MKNMIRAVAMVAALTMTSLVFAQGLDVNEFFKKKNPSEVYNRIITITPTTKWVNVVQGEIVKFVDTNGGASFIWNVDTTDFRLDLAAVAPARALEGRRIVAYIVPKCDCSGRGS